MAALTPAELLDSLNSDRELASAYMLYGPETYFMDRALALILAQAFPGGAGRDLNYHVLAGKEIKGDAVVREARTMPMFSSRRVLLLRQLQMVSTAELEPLIAYLKAPSPSTCLLLFSASKVDGRTTLGKTLAAKTVLVECRHPYENQLPPLLRQMAQKRQIVLSRDAESYLIEVVGADLLALDDAMERLRLFAGRDQTIDLLTVRKCVADTRVHEIWDLTDAIGERNLEKALKVLQRLRSEGMEAGRAVPMLARTVRQLWQVKGLGAAATRAEAVSQALGVPTFIAKNLAGQARRFSTDDLAEAIIALHQADLTVKSAELPSSVREWVVLEELVWKLASSS